MNEAMKKLMDNAQREQDRLGAARPVPVRQYNVRVNEDAREALAEMSRSLKQEGHPGHEYLIIDALLISLRNPVHREYVRHLLGRRGKLRPDETAELP